TVGTPELNTTQLDSVVAARLPAGAGALASLAPGDRIVRINDDSIRTWDDVVRVIVTGPAELRFGIAGRTQPLVIDVGRGGLAARQAVADALVPRVPVVVQRLEEGRPAARAGLAPGDLVLRIDGVPVKSVERFLERIWDSPGRPLRVDVRRGADSLSITVVPEVAAGAAGPRLAVAIHGLFLDQPGDPQPAADPDPGRGAGGVPARRGGASQAAAARAAVAPHADRVRGAARHHDPRHVERRVALVGACLQALGRSWKTLSRGA